MLKTMNWGCQIVDGWALIMPDSILKLNESYISIQTEQEHETTHMLDGFL